VAGPCLIGVKQPVPEVHQGIQILNRAHRTPRIDAPQEQHFRAEPRPEAGQVSLVEQRLADRAVRLGAQSPYRLAAIPVGAQQIRAQVTSDL
jgi:hypothetical protein